MEYIEVDVGSLVRVAAALIEGWSLFWCHEKTEHLARLSLAAVARWYSFLDASYDIEHGVSKDDANAQLWSKRCSKVGVEIQVRIEKMACAY